MKKERNGKLYDVSARSYAVNNGCLYCLLPGFFFYSV